MTLCKSVESEEVAIKAHGMYYRELNNMVKRCVADGVEVITLDGVNGQRYIADGITGNQQIIINGTPGNDLAAYMNGPELVVNGNAQDAIGNTMNAGRIIVHGNAGDTVGYAMRGGEIFVRGNVGYRVGIHMKEYKEIKPVVVIGGIAGDFFGEYMAGGRMILLGLGVEEEQQAVGSFCGTGMHGGIIYIRGEVDEYQVGKEVKIVETDLEDEKFLNKYITRFATYFGYRKEEIMKKRFKKLIPFNKRPYGNLYAPW